MDRIKQLQNKLKSKKINAALISKPENVRYLCGFIGSNGRLFVTLKGATLITDFRYITAAKKMVPKKVKIFDQKDGVKKLIGRLKNLGIEDTHLTYAGFLAFEKNYPKLKLITISGIVEEMRMIKDADEMKIIRKAVKIANTAFEKFVKTIKIGQSETDMEWNLMNVCHESGADGFSFPPIIAIGKNTADVHHKNCSDKLKKGDKIMVDFGIIHKGYCTDMTRMLYTDKSILSSRAESRNEQKIYSIVLKANEDAIKSVKLNRSFAEIDKTARDVIVKAGYAELFGHSTGHGVGLEVHEQPGVSEKSALTVKPGMLFTIEPGIYSEKLGGGIRIEDMVYFDKKGKIEVLTSAVSKKIRIIQ